MAFDVKIHARGRVCATGLMAEIINRAACGEREGFRRCDDGSEYGFYVDNPEDVGYLKDLRTAALLGRNLAPITQEG